MIGKYIKLKSKDALGVILIAALALAVRLIFLFLTDNFSGIPPAQRVVYAQRLQFGLRDYGILDPCIPILYPYVLKLWLALTREYIFSPRIFSLIVGLATLVPFFLVVKALKGKAHALLATFLLAVFPLHAIYSTLSLEEAPFYFIILCAIYLFLRYATGPTEKVCPLILSAALIACSSGFRFEGIIYAVLLSLFLAKEKSSKLAFLFALISLSLPSMWLILCKMKFGDPFFSYTWQSYYSPLNTPGVCNIWCMLERIIRSFSLPFLLLGILGWWVSLKDSRMRLLNVIFLVFFVIFAAKIAMRTLSSDPKYFLSFGIFFIVYVAIGIFYFARDFTHSARSRLFIFIFCAYGLLFSGRYISNPDTIARSFSLPPEIKQMAALLPRAEFAGRILLDVDYMNWYPEHIILLSGIGVERFKIAEEVDVFGHRVKNDAYIETYKTNLLGLLNRKQFTYLFYSPQGRSLRFLRPCVEPEEVFGKARYRRIFAGELYWVYKLENPD